MEEILAPEKTTETQPMVVSVHKSGFCIGNIEKEEIRQLISINTEIWASYKGKDGSESLKRIICLALVRHLVFLGETGKGEDLMREEDFIEPLILGENGGLEYAWLSSEFVGFQVKQ